MRAGVFHGKNQWRILKQNNTPDCFDSKNLQMKGKVIAAIIFLLIFNQTKSKDEHRGRSDNQMLFKRGDNN